MCVFKNHAFIYFLRPLSWSGTVRVSLQPILLDNFDRFSHNCSFLDMRVCRAVRGTVCRQYYRCLKKSLARRTRVTSSLSLFLAWLFSFWRFYIQAVQAWGKMWRQVLGPARLEVHILGYQLIDVHKYCTYRSTQQKYRKQRLETPHLFWLVLIVLMGQSHEILHLNFSPWNTSAEASDWNPSVNSHMVSTIFLRCRQQRRSFFHAVVHNAEKLLALWTTTRKNTHKLKLEQFFPPCCLLQSIKIIGIIGNNEEHFFTLCQFRGNVWHSGQQYRITDTTQDCITFFVSLSLPWKRKFT